MRYLQNVINTHATPQTEPLAYRRDQVRNSAGGFVWTVHDWTRLERFLILGSEGGTYYIQERALTVENATAVTKCLKADGRRVVRTVVEISTAGRAPKNEPALFVLAMAASPNFADARTMSAALDALPEVARTGMHLCNFAAFVENLRGWGRGLRSAVAEWYLNKPASELAYQMLKYQHRNGWSHRDLLRLSHPKAETPAHNALFQWAVEGEVGHLATPEILSGDLRQIRAFELANKSTSEVEIVELIEDHRLTHEMIPSEWKNSARVWESLLRFMPYMALVRHLGKLTAVGLLQPQSPATALVVARLIDRKRVANSRVHPIALLAALLTYKQGRGQKGGMEWAGRSTDASLPMRDALDRKLAVDAFVIVTDNETWAGDRHPVQALERYRLSSGIAAKLVVIAMAANGYSIADPEDAFQMDVVGFDASVPEVVAGFLKGRPSE